MQFLTDLSDYMPHGMCLLWQPWLVILWVGSDLLIFLSYFMIPLALLQVIRQRSDIRHRGLVLLFAAFIMLCGLTHALSVYTLWVPAYPQLGLVKLATGLVSAGTAYVLFRLVPALVAIPSQNDLEQANRSLRVEIAAHEETLARLRQTQRDLERQVEERTAELTTANAKLAVAAREAVHRGRNLITVVSAIARQSARSIPDTATFVETLSGRLNALAAASSTVINGVSQSTASLEEIVKKQLEPVLLTYPDQVIIEGPEISTSSEAAQPISLALHELATNAQKYGSLTAAGAKIRVSWTTRGNKDSGRFILRWEEDLASSGRTPRGEEPGFGTQLLTRIVPSMLQGETSRSVEDGRLVYELTVPLAALRGAGPQLEDAPAAALGHGDWGLA
ncbi:sensor histidine kinase [Roseobacteraceae bacterium NS-SX3]